MRFFEPEAAFYLFCSVDGFADSRALALRLIDEAGVGAAPGGAFGPGGEGHLRLCFARDPDRDRRSDPAHGALAEGVTRPRYGVRFPFALSPMLLWQRPLAPQQACL